MRRDSVRAVNTKGRPTIKIVPVSVTSRDSLNDTHKTHWELEMGVNSEKQLGGRKTSSQSSVRISRSPSLQQPSSSGMRPYRKRESSNDSVSSTISSISRTARIVTWRTLVRVLTFIRRLRGRTMEDKSCVVKLAGIDEYKRRGSSRSGQVSLRFSNDLAQRNQDMMKLGMTRQLAFGPWPDERVGGVSRNVFVRFIRDHARSLAMLLLFALVVSGLAFFLQKEKDVETKLKKKYGWMTTTTSSSL